ncbi:hypothetical protein LP52_16445 [Streptomonospora alba]|uniref:Uncharacterized protein n=1 Tax=Streptomonospora alba TaxID=183763 RepID=A0A0C2G3Q2_9ACTN|nr:DUF6114 domain-containing protein [Streptomonospora alba]KIH97918.1 hypothetical protein LP52_16445 [Streptomonospora alba]
MTRNGTSRSWRTARAAFRQWRGARPFWGGLLILLAGIIIVAAPVLNPLDLIVEQGVAGISGYFAGLLLMAVGVLVWLQPPQRFFYGIAAVLLSLVSFVTSNFGGFVFGMLFGLIGGALTAAWVPDRARRTASESPSSPARKRLAGLRGSRAGRASEAETAVQPASEAAADESDSGAGDPSAPGSRTGPAEDETGPAREIGDSAQDSAHDASDTGSTGSRAGGATYFTSPTPSSGAAAGRRRPADEAAPGSDEGLSAGDGGPSGGGRMHSLAAIAAALVFAVPAPAAATWPWDDWFGGDSGEETAEPDPSATPTPSPTPSPSGGADDGAGGAQGEQDGSAEEAEDGEGEEEEAPEAAEECSVQEGPASMSEEEFRALLEACRQAKEDGEAPDFQVRQGDPPEGDGRWLAHTDTSGLSADTLSMSGAAFEGVVEYPVQGGTVRYLKMSMDTAELSGARQWAEHAGTTTSLEIPEMTMSGDVVMHVTRMKVRILGIPLEFTPDFPPPLLLPSMTVTDLEADQPLAQAQTVNITGLDEQVES